MTIRPADTVGITAAAAAALAAAAAAIPPALAAFFDALDQFEEFIAEDAIQAGQPLPGGRGVYGPDTATAERLRDAVITAAEAAFAPPAAAPAAAPDTGAGLLTTWHAGDRMQSPEVVL